MRQIDVWQIPKQNVSVELALPGAPARPVEVFLAEHQANSLRRQRITDLLEQEQAFLPARDSSTGVWEIVNKESLLWVRVLLGPLGQAEEAGDELFDYQRRVRVELEGGDPLEGELLYSAPQESSRVVDYFNQAGRFFCLWEEDRLYLINKSYILRVVELS